jgi:hypothetical protein
METSDYYHIPKIPPPTNAPSPQPAQSNPDPVTLFLENSF